MQGALFLSVFLPLDRKIAEIVHEDVELALQWVAIFEVFYGTFRAGVVVRDG